MGYSIWYKRTNKEMLLVVFKIVRSGIDEIDS